MSQSNQQLARLDEIPEDSQSRLGNVRLEAEEDLSAALRVIQLQSREVEKLRAETSGLEQEVKHLELIIADERQKKHKRLTALTKSLDRDKAKVQDLTQKLLDSEEMVKVKEEEVLELQQHNTMLTKEIGYHRRAEIAARETEMECERMHQENSRSRDRIAQLEEENTRLSAALRQRTADTQESLSMLNEASVRRAVTEQELYPEQLISIETFLTEGRPPNEYQPRATRLVAATGSRSRVAILSSPRGLRNMPNTSPQAPLPSLSDLESWPKFAPKR